jgi:sulfate transport system ATP-binding protein
VVLMNKGHVEQIGTPDEVYERPASPFVYGFLGTVNVFHGRAGNGRFQLGPVSIDAPEHEAVQDAPAVAFARPHEIEIDRFSPGLNGLPVQLSRLLVVGPTARLELEREDSSEVLEAEIPAARARALNLKIGETLLIRPRRMQVFVDAAKPADASSTPGPQPSLSLKEEPLPAASTVIW